MPGIDSDIPNESGSQNYRGARVYTVLQLKKTCIHTHTHTHTHTNIQEVHFQVFFVLIFV